MKKVRLSRGRFAYVDNEDFEKLKQFRWYINENSEKSKVYAMRSRLKHESEEYSGTKIYMHRYVLNITDKTVVVKHKNGNTLDNRKDNLFTKIHNKKPD